MLPVILRLNNELTAEVRKERKFVGEKVSTQVTDLFSTKNIAKTH